MAVLSTAGRVQWRMFLESGRPMPHSHPEPYSESSEVFNVYIYIRVDGYGCTRFPVHLSDLQGWTLRGAVCCYVNIEYSVA